MDLDRMAEAVAKLNAKAEPDLVSIAAPRRLLATDRVGFDQVEGAVELVENELIARRNSLRRWAGRDLKFI